MGDSSEIDSCVGSASAPVEATLVHLRIGINAEEPVIHTVQALDEIGRTASNVQERGAPPPELADEASRLMFALAPRVVHATAGAISADRIYFGLGCANALLIAAPDNFHLDRVLYLGWLLADLRSFVCRSELSRRGDPLMRVVLARRAWEATAGPDVSLQ